MQACQQLGMIVRTIAGSSIALCPPLIITKAQIDEIVFTLEKAIDASYIFASKNNYLV